MSLRERLSMRLLNMYNKHRCGMMITDGLRIPLNWEQIFWDIKHINFYLENPTAEKLRNHYTVDEIQSKKICSNKKIEFETNRILKKRCETCRSRVKSTNSFYIQMTNIIKLVKFRTTFIGGDKVQKFS